MLQIETLKLYPLALQTLALMPLSVVSAPEIQWAYGLDGVDDRYQTLFRALQLEGKATLKFYTPDSDKALGVITSQNITGTFANREFQLWTDTNGTRLLFLFGGGSSVIVGTVSPNTQYVLVFEETTYTLKTAKGVVVHSGEFTRGTARELTAATVFGANTDNASHTNFFKGLQYDVSIDDVFWPVQEKEHLIQLPQPTGLGGELYTPEVIANPSSKGSQWTHLGNGRWQLTGDGSYSELIFLSIQPRGYLLEFEIESISGGSIRCYTPTAQTANMTNHIFNTVGKHRFVLTSPTQGAYQSFVRHSGSVNCVIKNIKLKPLWVESATDLVLNGNFGNGTTGWSANGGVTFSVVSGQANLGCVAGQVSRIEQTVSGLEAGAWYIAIADLVSATGCNARLNIIRNVDGNYRGLGGSNAAAGTTNTKLQHIFKAPATTCLIQVSSDAGGTNGTLIWDNITLKKLVSLCNPLVMMNTTSDRWQDLSNTSLSSLDFSKTQNSQYLPIL